MDPALMDFGNIYYGLAMRALDQCIAAVKSKSSLALSRSMTYHPEVQHSIAEMVIELESIGPHLETIAQDCSNGIDHGRNSDL
jgi:alkylation response protein AidB-like acyl-CoA dehydrogenase